MNEKKLKKLVHHSRSSLAADVFRRYVHNWAADVGAVLLIIILIGIIFADLIAPASMITAYDSSARLSPPSAAHAPMASGLRNAAVIGPEATPPESNATPVNMSGTKYVIASAIA